MINPQEPGFSISSSSVPSNIKKTEPLPSSSGLNSRVRISKFVDDIAVGKVTASDGAISCSAPTPRQSYLEALLGEHPPLEKSFSRVKDEDFPELIKGRAHLVNTKYSPVAVTEAGSDLFPSQQGPEEDSLVFRFSASSLAAPSQRFVIPSNLDYILSFTFLLSGGTAVCLCQRWAPVCPSVLL